MEEINEAHYLLARHILSVSGPPVVDQVFELPHQLSFLFEAVHGVDPIAFQGQARLPGDIVSAVSSIDRYAA